MSHLIRVALVAASAATFAACSTSKAPQKPGLQALRASQSAVAIGVDDGLDAADHLDQYTVDLRHNPCGCDAPDAEIYIHGRWTRARLDGPDAVLDELRRRWDPSDPATAVIRVAVTGEVDGDERTDAGLMYVVFQIETIPDPD